MTLPQPELPPDMAGCHTLIKQLHAELQVASQRIEEMASVGLHEATTRIAHLEALLAENQKTIADQQQTIKNLSVTLAKPRLVRTAHRKASLLKMGLWKKPSKQARPFLTTSISEKKRNAMLR